MNSNHGLHGLHEGQAHFINLTLGKSRQYSAIV